MMHVLNQNLLWYWIPCNILLVTIFMYVHRLSIVSRPLVVMCYLALSEIRIVVRVLCHNPDTYMYIGLLQITTTIQIATFCIIKSNKSLRPSKRLISETAVLNGEPLFLSLMTRLVMSRITRMYH